jgi:hypothetical protein
MELPFKLRKGHKSYTKCHWKKRTGLKESDEKIEELYNRYIIATHCELCNKQFKSSKDRQMEHDHETGKFRNITCNSCNMKKHDVKMLSNNTSGYKGISKRILKKYKQGFIWVFDAVINGRQKTIKCSTDLEFLKAFADQWKIDNNYNT